MCVRANPSKDQHRGVANANQCRNATQGDCLERVTKEGGRIVQLEFLGRDDGVMRSRLPKRRSLGADDDRPRLRRSSIWCTSTGGRTPVLLWRQAPGCNRRVRSGSGDHCTLRQDCKWRLSSTPKITRCRAERSERFSFDGVRLPPLQLLCSPVFPLWLSSRSLPVSPLWLSSRSLPVFPLWLSRPPRPSPTAPDACVPSSVARGPEATCPASTPACVARGCSADGRPATAGRRTGSRRT